MFKYISLLLLSIAITGCNSNKNEEAAVPKADVILNAGVGVIVGTGNFGDITIPNTKILNLQITNSGDAPLQGPPVIDSQEFNIIYSNNCDNILPKKTCQLKVNFSSKSKTAGIHSANLNLDSAFVALSANVIDPNSLTDVSFSTGESLDFGTLNDKQSVLKTVVITNSGNKPINESIILGSKFINSYDNCSNKLLASKKTCQIKIILNGNGKSGLIADTLQFAGKTLALSGNVVSSQGNTALGSANLSYLVSGVAQTNYNMGSFSGSKNSQLIINLTNSGTAASSISSASLSAGSTGYSIAFNQCNNISLAKNASCQIRVVFSSSGLMKGSYPAQVSFGTSILNITAVVESLISFQPVYSSFGSCSAQACDGSGTQVRSLSSCQKLVNNSPVSGGIISDCAVYDTVGYLQQSCLSPAGNKTIGVDNGSKIVSCSQGSSIQNLVSITCNEGFVVNGETCQPVASYTVGFKLVTDIYESTVATQQITGCKITLNLPQGSKDVLVRPNVTSLSQYNDFSSYNPPSPSVCNQTGMRFAGLSLFTQEIDSSDDEVLCRRISGTGNRGSVKISMQDYFDIGGCDGLMFSASNTQYSTIEITSGLIIEAANPETMIGIGDSLFFVRRDSFGKSLYEVSIPNSDDGGLPVTTDIYQEIKNLFPGENPSLSNLDEVNGQLVFTLATSNDNKAMAYNVVTKTFRELISGLEAANWYKIPGGAIFFVRDNNENKTYIYKTTDLINMVKLPTAIYDINTNVGNSVFSNAYEMNGFLYGLGNNNGASISKVNLTTGEQTILYTYNNGFTTVFGGDKMYIIEQINSGGSNDTNGKIYKISSSGVLTQLYSNIKYYQSIVRDSSLIYLTTRNYNTGLVRVDKLDIATDILSNVSQDLNQSGACDIDTVIGIQAVHPLNHSLIYDCNGNGSLGRRIKSLSSTGTISTVLEGYSLSGSLSSYYDSDFHGSEYLRKFKVYKNSFFVTGFSDALGIKMVKITAQNQGSILHVDTNQGSNDYSSPLIVLKNNLFFGGNSNQGESPLGEFEIYKLFEN